MAGANTKIISGTWHTVDASFPAGIAIISSQSMGQLNLAIALSQAGENRHFLGRSNINE